MAFSNPIAAGNILAQDALKSPNFSEAGETGWAINRDGSAFFFNVTASGSVTATQFQGSNFIINSSGIFFYNTTIP